MLMSQREAARRWGLGRVTIQRAISAGKLSVTAEKLIDPAEMVRAFGEPKPAQSRPETPDVASHEPTQEPVHLAVTIARLEAENAALRDLVQRADAERDRALDTVQRLLAHDGTPRRRWWQFGRTGP